VNMTSKHSPATPLPWIALGVNLRLAIYGEQSQHMVASVRDDRDNATASDIQDADYLTHAANAYPQLVSALRSGIDSLGQFVKLGRIPENNQGLRDMRALLRSLGEDA